MEEDTQLSGHFSYKRLLWFTLPSIVMMVFTSVYSIIDGIFVSNFVGKTPFAAINLIFPFLMSFGAIGFMFGTGGSALVAKIIGEGDYVKANRTFSMIVYVLITIGILLSVMGTAFIQDVAVWLGATGDMIVDCVTYARLILPMMAAYLLQGAFQAFLIAAGKPGMGLWVTVGAGIANIVLDWLFIVILDWGLEGAALATCIGQCVGGIVPLVYFACPNHSLLRLVGFHFDGRALVKASINGASELISNLSMSVVAMLYNFQLMKYIGEDGVAAFGVIMYASFIFISVFLGYAIGSSPIVSYNLGSGNYAELKGVFRKSLVITGCLGMILVSAAELVSSPLATVFASYDEGLFLLTRKAFRLYALSFLIAGFNIYASAFFTALNNGVVSAIISFSRTLVFECGTVILIPVLLGINGIWLAIDFAETATLSLSVVMLFVFRKRYGY